MKDNKFLLLYCFVGAFIIFAPLAGVVFPEYALFYKIYGFSGHPDASRTLHAFLDFSGGWYRPLSFLAAPFLLGVDLLNPASVVIFNIIFFSGAAYLAAISFLPKGSFFEQALAASFMLSAPALQSVAYFPVIDALYIIFGIATLLALEKSYLQNAKTFSKINLVCLLYFFLALTSKEVGILALLIAPAFIVMRQVGATNQPLTFRLVKSATWHCLPFIALAVVYYAAYVLVKGVSSSNSDYATVPILAHFGKISRYIAGSLNIACSGFTDPWLKWITQGYDAFDTAIRTLLYLVAAIIFVVTFQKKRIGAIASFVGFLAILTIPLALFHVHPHHTFPLVIVLAIVISASVSIARLRLTASGSSIGRVASIAIPGLLLALSLTLMYRAFEYNSQALQRGIHGFVLRYNTALFHDGYFKQLVQKKPSYLLVEECPDAWSVGAYSGVLPYYGGSTNSLGEEYVSKGSMLRRARAKALETETAGGQLLGLECHPEATPPYTVVNFSQGSAAFKLPPVAVGKKLLFDPSGEGLIYLAHGWSSPEAWGVWSDGDSAGLDLQLASPRLRSILIEANAFVSDKDLIQEVDILLNGAIVKVLRLTRNMGNQIEVAVPEKVREQLRGDGALKIEFQFKSAVSPKSLGTSEDARRLGLGLLALTVRE
jgi:hypothetical protein